MRAVERLMTDLEEEILFLLSLQKDEMSTLVIAERVGSSMNKFVSLATVHRTLLQLESDGLICTKTLNTKRNHKITPAGVVTLQTEWSHYNKSLNGQ